MKRLSNTTWALGLAAATLASCSSGGDSSNGGSMSIESCILGCTNGVGGSQVSCGVVNTFQNQEIAVVFSSPVDFGSVSKSSFQVLDVETGSVPVGNFLVDPADSRRLIFRPELGFDIQGNPIFGFAPGASYEIRIPGSTQGDPPPFVRSTSGQSNASRLLCTITTDQGISDPVPGPPLVTVFVNTVDPATGDITEGVVANGATSVDLESPITMVFNDLMNLGTLVIPGTGEAPFIEVRFDPDGNIGDASDQVLLAGDYTFNIDQLTLQTTVVFRSSQPFPGAGDSQVSPRKIIVRLPEQIKDLSGNELGNAGPVIFTPVSVDFPPLTIPNGGEDFMTQTLRDTERSGADWGVTSPGLLTPGVGGGSGRLGDLIVEDGVTVTLVTGPTPAIGSITWFGDPNDNDVLSLNGFDLSLNSFEFLPWPTVDTDPPFLFETVGSITAEINTNKGGTPAISDFEFFAKNGDTLEVVASTPGPAGNDFTFEYTPNGTNVTDLSQGVTRNLEGGADGVTYAAGNLLDNFDFEMNPGGEPGDITVEDGVFEFSSIQVRSGGTLRLVGPNPARLLSRGRTLIEGVVDASGLDAGLHPSGQYLGQPGGRGGPNGGSGGRGAHREDDRNKGAPSLYGVDPDFTNPGTPPKSQGVDHPGVMGPQDGQPGEGIGRVGMLAAGLGGVQFPATLPISRNDLGDLETNAMCVSEQVGGAGSGAAYAIDGIDGVPMSPNMTSSQGGSNVPGDTTGGASADAGLDPTVRELNPTLGNLRGGAGGGGGGAHPFDTATDGGGTPDACIDAGASISTTIAVPYRSHSGAGGGGAGGGVQVATGDRAQYFGIIDASGGSGGSAEPAAGPENTQAAPGGGASGGAVLLQSREALFALNPGRINVSGGAGGAGVGGSTGGDGSYGLVRFETDPPFNNTEIMELAERIAPFDPGDPTSSTFLSVGTFNTALDVPDTMSGAQSCWIRPDGGFFSLDFKDDTADTPGWNMDLVLNLGGGPVTRSYRGNDGPMGMSYEEVWGQLLDRDLPMGETGAPLVVRFQGGKLVGDLDDPCDVDISGNDSPFLPGSVTPWVRHPAELKAFSPPPDAIRFVIIFDSSKPDFSSIIGVTNLAIIAQPR